MTRVVKADVRLVGDDEAVVGIEPGEQVFAGHYPGFPIFPGVCVIDSVHRAALAAAPQQAITLAAVESARFVGAVYPGDELRIELRWKQREASWVCGATARTQRGDVASVRLCYETGGRS